MIGRVWHGWTELEDGDAFEKFLKATLPSFHRHAGYRHAYLMRMPKESETEFLVVTYWDSMEAVRGFAGADGKGSVILPEARKLLKRWDEKPLHYDAVRVD
ncbi:MAG TPA: antibiotic biosynthesis monooxygenase [Alphaproteobacteria bacterium]|nr:antibiotic biosynthesis monooxygenase [Alphaproteobacteria bacterium]